MTLSMMTLSIKKDVAPKWLLRGHALPVCGEDGSSFGVGTLITKF
jgi:hypothetical protein